ncbi:hypothetical protein [Micromonospora sp. DT47]|uniref:hypothetical protein n=1 Tax=Micromonospora sp. DT47 TaxID=3393431 RepID=UPI003CF014D6
MVGRGHPGQHQHGPGGGEERGQEQHRRGDGEQGEQAAGAGERHPATISRCVYGAVNRNLLGARELRIACGSSSPEQWT